MGIPASWYSHEDGKQLVSYPLGPKQVVVQCSEPLSGVIAAVRSSHQVLYHQSNINQTYPVIRR